MKYKKYPSYKDSGVEWLGEIPVHWNINTIKSLLEERKESNSPVKTDNILSLCMYRGVIPYSEKGTGGNKAKEDLTAYKLAYPGDIVLNSMNVVAGSVGLSKYFGAVSPVYYMLRPRKKENSVEYFNDIFQSESFQKSLFGLGNGIMVKESQSTGKLNTIRMRIPMDKLNTVLIPYPSSEEQQQIASFLDNATAKIDTLIEKQTKLIEILKEKRQAVISHAVTKGINPDVKMKDSGVEWLGEIPEHWDISRIKFNGKVKGRIGFRGYTKDDLVDKTEGALVIGASEINNNAEIILDSPQYISWYKYYESPEIILKKDDILFVQRGSTVGKVAHINYDIEESTINPSLVVIKEIKIDECFLKYYLMSNIIKSTVKVQTSSTAIPMISQEQIGNYVLSYPEDKTEQQQIANYLDDKTSKMDKLIEKANKSIELLKEKRTALISAAVTGKIDVRELV